jgi:hypothetical protein
MREFIYNNNLPDNWMGSVNCCITLASAGGIAGFLFPAVFCLLAGMAMGRSISGCLAVLVMCICIGVLAGSIVHFAVPGIRAAFKEYRPLYYAAPVIFSAFGILMIMLSIKIKIRLKKEYEETNDFFNHFPGNNGEQ